MMKKKGKETKTSYDTLDKCANTPMSDKDGPRTSSRQEMGSNLR